MIFKNLFINIPLIIQDTAVIEGDMGMLWMLLSGILVFFMQAGFTLVESGMTSSKNAVNIAMKNLLDICVGSLTYWLVGYSLMYGDTSNGWFFGVDYFKVKELIFSFKPCLLLLLQQLYQVQLLEEQNSRHMQFSLL